jgi:hypothetical protein
MCYPDLRWWREEFSDGTFPEKFLRKKGKDFSNRRREERKEKNLASFASWRFKLGFDLSGSGWYRENCAMRNEPVSLF